MKMLVVVLIVSGIGISAAGINDDEDICDRFSDITAYSVGENAWKQLKMRKLKVFIAVMNQKNSSLPKKFPSYKTHLGLSYSHLTTAKLKSYNSNCITYAAFVNPYWKYLGCIGYSWSILKFCIAINNCFSTDLFKGLQIIKIFYLLN